MTEVIHVYKVIQVSEVKNIQVVCPACGVENVLTLVSASGQIAICICLSCGRMFEPDKEQQDWKQV